MTTRPGRVPFIDLARSIAVVAMIQGHTLAVLLRPEYQINVIFGLWLYLRGLTSCGFLMLAGFSFAVATDRHWADYLTMTPRLRKRLVRFGAYLLLGYAMRIPVRPLTDISRTTAAQWQAFGAVDILQLVGVTLALLQGMVWLAGTRRRLAVTSLAATGAVVLLTPAVWAVDWTSTLPLFVASYFSIATGSLFPLFPWAAYILFGAALGTWFVIARQREGAFDASRPFFLAGGAMLAAGLVLSKVPFEPLGPTQFWTTSPNLFLAKGGAVLVLLSAAIRSTRSWTDTPRMATVLSRESLTIYYVHLAILYGSIWNQGMNQIIGPRLAFVPTLGWITILVGSMGLLAWVWHECKHKAGDLSTLIRATVAASLLYVIV